MFRSSLTASVLLYVVACFALAGCGEVPRSSQPSQSQSVDRTADMVSNQENAPQTYVTCRATMTDYDKNHPWFDNGDFGNDDGVSPLASFKLTEPPIYSGQLIGILFKYTVDDATISPPDRANIGEQFTFQIPEAALKRQYTTIDNLSVRSLRRNKP